jgi:hypothetical protein
LSGHHFYTSLLKALEWSFIFIAPSALIALWINLSKPLEINDQIKKMRLTIEYLAFVCFYFMALVVLIPGSEQERYRFVVEGLIIILFLFWVSSIYQYIARLAYSKFKREALFAVDAE